MMFFSAAFVVDPLYRQTTAKFDEGGAKGLLMNNLGVYGGCRVLFDSQEVPAKCMEGQNRQDISDTIDLSFLRGVFLSGMSGGMLLQFQIETHSTWPVGTNFSL